MRETRRSIIKQFCKSSFRRDPSFSESKEINIIAASLISSSNKVKGSCKRPGDENSDIVFRIGSSIEFNVSR
jgi:hypothetical protein